MSRVRRVAVTSPQTRLARRRDTGPWRFQRLDATGLRRADDLYRAQRTPALLTLAGLVALLGGLPAVFTWFPGLDQLRLAGVPLSWLMLGVLPFPAMALLAWWQLRRAERLEDER